MGILRSRLQRLRDEVDSVDIQWGHAQERVAVDDADANRALAVARSYLDAAREAAGVRKLQRGWIQLHRARQALAGTYDHTRLDLVADDLMRCCITLDDASRNLVHAWLGDGFSKRDLAQKRRTVMEAMRVRDERWDVFFHAARLAEQRLNYLAFYLSVILSVLVGAAALGAFPILGGATHPGSFAATIVALGMAGGTASAMVGVVTGNTRRILAEEVRDGPWHLLRPLFGGGSALVIVLALSAGLLGLQPLGADGYYAVAAFAGFSEGLITRVAGAFAGRAAPSARDEALRDPRHA